MQYRFMGDMYVRESFARYYDHIMQEFRSGVIDNVMVTGPSGTGKSMFMGYFFLRYRLENPEARIVAEAYNAKSMLNARFLWQNRRGHRLPRNSEMVDDPNAITLLDGPPTREPPTRYWICFASLNKHWDRLTWKNQCHRRVFLPPWELEELRDAARVLELQSVLEPMSMEEAEGYDFGLDGMTILAKTDVIQIRAGVFGLVPRVCLSCCTSYVNQYFDMVKKAVFRLRHIKLEPLMYPDSSSEEERDLVVGRVISPGFSSGKERLASPFIRQMLAGKLRYLSDQVRVVLERELLDFHPLLASFVLERRAHQFLIDSGSFEAQQLLPACENGTAVRSIKSFHVDLASLSQQSPVLEPCFVRLSSEMLSVDSFYSLLSSGTPGDGQPSVILFQVATTLTPSVDGDVIVELLRHVGLWELLRVGHSNAVTLVFIVPQKKLSKFGFQRIVSPLAVALVAIPQYVWGV
ncbi:hypothetical protein Poli38472_013048 [Pythium oligandrum]|uniref:Uncharacterized protein n=1 Tax=Pythium oligandrum TaxID=41045 RepID=A0A8K1FJ12_PYTOL|nr:hypothetical protein Poli38472_013048 [Pythium oligandrum]|eukprot:TMW64426.1 hypothetical protein Poli38472_013048 [Pythium oligandrum]